MLLKATAVDELDGMSLKSIIMTGLAIAPEDNQKPTTNMRANFMMCMEMCAEIAVKKDNCEQSHEQFRTCPRCDGPQPRTRLCMKVKSLIFVHIVDILLPLLSN